MVVENDFDIPVAVDPKIDVNTPVKVRECIDKYVKFLDEKIFWDMSDTGYVNVLYENNSVKGLTASDSRHKQWKNWSGCGFLI